VIEVTFNDLSKACRSVRALKQLLERFDQEDMFELWLKTKHGPMISMLRNRANAFLMYLRAEGDSGFTSRGANGNVGSASFRLSNGEEHQYPLSWCIGTSQCYEALIEFFSQNGNKPDSVIWHED
jgi:hypothetical protein